MICRILITVIKIRFRTWRNQPWLLDLLLVALLFTLHLFTQHYFAQLNPDVPWPPDWRILLDLAAIGPLALRQLFPRSVFVVVFAAEVLIVFLHLPSQVVGFAELIALYTVQVHAGRRWAIAALVAVLGFRLWPFFVIPQPVVVGPVLELSVTILITAALGQLRRRYLRRTAELQEAVALLEQARERLAEEAVLVERARIARELHDIVAHGISLIAVRAGVARALLPGNPGQARESIEVIEHAARESLAEMRHMLGALRAAGDEPGDAVRPQPGLDRLDELIRFAESSGLTVDVVREGDVHALPPGQELAAYRIVQEALTNVVKHAGPVPATVTLRYLPDRLVVEVVNTTRVPAPRLSVVDSGGHGLIGMRERAALYGGSVRAGRVDGGFRVTAELPMLAVAV